MVRGVACKGCNAERPPEVASMNPRPPCPECGERGVAIGATATSSLAITASVEAALTPGEQERTWERRWQDAQAHLARLISPRTEPLDSDSVHAAHAELQSFFIQTYHLKDTLNFPRSLGRFEEYSLGKKRMSLQVSEKTNLIGNPVNRGLRVRPTML